MNLVWFNKLLIICSRCKRLLSNSYLCFFIDKHLCFFLPVLMIIQLISRSGFVLLSFYPKHHTKAFGKAITEKTIIENNVYPLRFQKKKTIIDDFKR